MEGRDELREETHVTISTTVIAAALTGAMTSMATAGVVNDYITQGASTAALDAAGYTSLTNGTPLLIEPTGCEGCYSFPNIPGPLALTGYIELEFQMASDYLWLGYNVLMQFNLAGTGWADIAELATFLGGSDIGDVSILGLAAASNSICDWSIDIDAFSDAGYIEGNTLVFRWAENDTPPAPGTTYSTTFAWDFSDLAGGPPGFNGGGFLGGVGATPAPGALAIFGLCGFVGRRRRR